MPRRELRLADPTQPGQHHLRIGQARLCAARLVPVGHKRREPDPHGPGRPLRQQMHDLRIAVADLDTGVRAHVKAEQRVGPQPRLVPTTGDRPLLHDAVTC
jgi:hypothetical protein